MNALRRDLGSGMTDPEVDEFNETVDTDALLSYRFAVGRRTREVVGALREEDLDEVIGSDLIRRARDEGAFGPNAEWVPQRWEGKRKAFTLTHTVLGHAF